MQNKILKIGHGAGIYLNKECLNHLNAHLGDYINLSLLRDGTIVLNKFKSDINNDSIDIDMNIINDLLVKVNLDDFDS